jgi:hypothetical protein
MCIYFHIFVWKVSVQENRRDVEGKSFLFCPGSWRVLWGEIDENFINSLQLP